MPSEMTCPICDAEIPLEGGEEAGDLILCSYCNVTFKLIRKKGEWFLSEEFEE